MIVVAGSRHDPVAQELVRRWPGAALCGAGDLTTRGWRWSAPAGTDAATWVVDGVIVPDAEVTGVFVRRSAVYPDEFPGTHPDDRGYLAAEVHAFLVFVLATTRARVVNPVSDGALGANALRPERWMGVAARVGVAVAPLRVTSGTSDTGDRNAGQPRPAEPATIVEVVGGEPVATPPGRLPPGPLGDAAAAVTGALGLTWAVAAFDDGGRLSGLSTTRPPSSDAVGPLGRLLAGRAA